MTNPQPEKAGNRPEDKTESLLAKKRKLSYSVLLPPEAEEEEKLSLAKEIFSYGTEVSEERTPFTILDVDQIPPTLFEVCVAALYREMGYEALTTPLCDRGADVVILPREGKGGRGILIQCKQVRRSGDLVGPAAVREIVAARSVYEPLHDCKFDLAVVTNAAGFTSVAVELANANGVELMARETLAKWLDAYPVERSEILFGNYGSSDYKETEIFLD